MKHRHPKEFPQRLAQPTMPGALLKRLYAVARQLQLIDSDPAYLRMVRQLPCLGCGLEPCGEAAHIRGQSGAYGKRSSMGKKPPDRWAVSLCGDCHREGPLALHRVGEELFFHRLGINPLLVASQLRAAKGDLVRMRAIVLLAMAEPYPQTEGVTW
jgi:hypothetical protein